MLRSVLLWSLLVALGVPSVATAQGPFPGTYVGKTERGETIALTLSKRGKVFQVTGVFGLPGASKNQIRFGTTYYPSKGSFESSWVQRAPRGKAEMPIKGKYIRPNDVFEVDIAFVSPGGGGHLLAFCSRAKSQASDDVNWAGTYKSGQHTMLITGTGDRYTIRFHWVQTENVHYARSIFRVRRSGKGTLVGEGDGTYVDPDKTITFEQKIGLSSDGKTVTVTLEGKSRSFSWKEGVKPYPEQSRVAVPGVKEQFTLTRTE